MIGRFKCPVIGLAGNDCYLFCSARHQYLYTDICSVRHAIDILLIQIPIVCFMVCRNLSVFVL